jgi:electron transfer flavoprotein alpha subunit
MGDILVYSEKDEITWELLSKGRELKARLAVALLGPGAAARSAEAFGYGADAAYVCEDAALAELQAEVVAEALRQIVEQAAASLILLGSTRRGKELAPRLAQKLGAGCVTDALGLNIVEAPGPEGGRVVAQRYALGGNTVATEAIATARQVVAVMPKTFEIGPQEARSGQVLTLKLALPQPRLKILEKRPKGGEVVDLEAAERLVCVGRGLAKREDLALIQALASALQAEIGCTRTIACDYAWLAEERLVGLSGRKCKPRLYLGVGISGQIQHTVGVMGSRLIVAINSDKEAPIFQIADYGIVGDLYQVVPRLTAKLLAG